MPSVLCLSPWRGPRPGPPPTSAAQMTEQGWPSGPPSPGLEQRGRGATYRRVSASDARLRGALGGGGRKGFIRCFRRPSPPQHPSWTSSRAAVPRESALAGPSGHLQFTELFHVKIPSYPKGVRSCSLLSGRQLEVLASGRQEAWALRPCVLCRRTARRPSPARPCLALIVAKP